MPPWEEWGREPEELCEEVEEAEFEREWRCELGMRSNGTDAAINWRFAAAI